MAIIKKKALTLHALVCDRNDCFSFYVGGKCHALQDMDFDGEECPFYKLDRATEYYHKIKEDVKAYEATHPELGTAKDTKSVAAEHGRRSLEEWRKTGKGNILREKYGLESVAS